MTLFLKAVTGQQRWPSIANPLGARHPVWGQSTATNKDRLTLLLVLLGVEGNRLQVWADPSPQHPPARQALPWKLLVDTAWDVHPKMALNLGVRGWLSARKMDPSQLSLLGLQWLAHANAVKRNTLDSSFFQTPCNSSFFQTPCNSPLHRRVSQPRRQSTPSCSCWSPNMHPPPCCRSFQKRRCTSHRHAGSPPTPPCCKRCPCGHRCPCCRL